LDDEILLQSSLARGLKGSIFTPKIVDGPRVRRSLTNTTSAVSNQQTLKNAPVATTAAPKKAKKEVKKQQVGEKENKFETDKKEKSSSTAAKTNDVGRSNEPMSLDSIEDDHDEEEEEDSGFRAGVKSHSRPVVLPSVIAMELKEKEKEKEPVAAPYKATTKTDPPTKSSSVVVVPVASEVSIPRQASFAPTPNLPSDIPVLVDVLKLFVVNLFLPFLL
jgi:hypothetical protein